jgi:hypothetical protein
MDDLFLDYTTTVNDQDPGKGIDIYQDRELHDLIVFFDFPSPRSASIRLYNMMGQKVSEIPSRLMGKERVKLNYTDINPGLYILEIVLNNKRLCRKFIFNP